MAIAVFGSFNSLQTVSLITLSNIYSNKVFWEYVSDEWFLTVAVAFQLLRAHGSFSGFAMFNQNYYSAVEKTSPPQKKKKKKNRTLLTKYNPIEI